MQRLVALAPVWEHLLPLEGSQWVGRTALCLRVRHSFDLRDAEQEDEEVKLDNRSIERQGIGGQSTEK